MTLSTFNLAAIPVKFVAIPALVVFAAGTGAFAAYVTAPTPAISASAQTTVAALPVAGPTPVTTDQTEKVERVKPATKPSCSEQTWPYIDNRCISRGNEPARNVRVVSARPDDSVPRAAASGTLVTSDTVLRGPGVAPEFDAQPVAKKSVKRSEARRQREESRRGTTVYTVPSASGAKPVIVVRPLRLDTYSSRF